MSEKREDYQITTFVDRPAMTVAEFATRYQEMQHLVKSNLREHVDFGVVPGTDKPTLLKPGAEKLTTFFGLRPTFEIVEKVEDWTGVQHNGEPFFYYLYRCRLIRRGEIIAEGDGSCNSMESKYRWRWVQESDMPPGDLSRFKKRGGRISEFTFAIEKAETGGKYGKPAEYWKQFEDAIRDGTATQITRTTASGKELAAYEIDATVYRVPNEDIASQVNTIQKMAQKRAFIGATLLGVNGSEFFTQDLEDIVDGLIVEAETRPAPAEKPAESKKQAAPKSEAQVMFNERAAALIKAGKKTEKDILSILEKCADSPDRYSAGLDMLNKDHE
jgi:hypothetical protein